MLLGSNRQTQLNDYEHSEVFHSCPLVVNDVLQIARDILPHKEMDFLDLMK